MKKKTFRKKRDKRQIKYENFKERLYKQNYEDAISNVEMDNIFLKAYNKYYNWIDKHYKPKWIGIVWRPRKQ